MIPHLDLTQMLPKIRAAWNAGELQAQQPNPSGSSNCSYAGPCVVGVCLPVELRPLFDLPGSDDAGPLLATLGLDTDGEPGNSSVGEFLDTGFMTCVEGQREDIENLQNTHDKVISERPDNREQNLSTLEALISSLEVKYLPAARS